MSMQNTTNIPETPTPTPKTINEALNILAYNEFFYQDPLKSHINPHHKDKDTIKSLVEANYAWTEKQGKLAVIILKRYLTKFQKFGLDIKDLLDNPKYDEPFRVISFEKSVEKYIDEEEVPRIDVKFPYSKKLVSLIRCLKDQRGLPGGYYSYDGESKVWSFLQTDVTTYYLTLIAIRYDFKFVDTTLLDDYDEVKKEITGFKHPSAILVGNEIIINNAPESLLEYWNKNLKDKKPLVQVDALKNFNISTQNININAYTEIGKKIAHNNNTQLWIDAKTYTRDQLIAGLTELDCFPIVMPVSGDPHNKDDVDDWRDWFKCFERHGIEYKNFSFGMDIKEPDTENHFMADKLTKDDRDLLWEIHQLSKQFKYIDKETKIVFVRNRIPRTLMKSKIKPKASLIALGGGYYTSGTDNLKRLLDNLPKKLYYNDHQPSNFDWHEKLIMKL